MADKKKAETLKSQRTMRSATLLRHIEDAMGKFQVDVNDPIGDLTQHLRNEIVNEAMQRG